MIASAGRSDSLTSGLLLLPCIAAREGSVEGHLQKVKRFRVLNQQNISSHVNSTQATVFLESKPGKKGG